MKPHIFDSESPFREGSDVIANCQTLVTNAVAIAPMESDAVEISGLRCCRKCVEATKARKDRRTVYGIVEGQEAINGGY